jgi:hypothetical protein
MTHSYHSKFTGSSLDRRKPIMKEQPKKLVSKAIPNAVKKEGQMSPRTKSKIRQKLFALAQLQKQLTFVALTFVNEVTDEDAVVMLRKFLDNVKKRSKDFQYLWVAERQTQNKVFPNNIHFHLITNKFWDIQKTWKYWLGLQASHGIKPRDENFKASSAFDVKNISTRNPRQLGMYLTKYVTKNTATFNCQVWNCSKKISALYTGFYSDYSFIEDLYRLKGEEVKHIELEYCSLYLIPLDKTTLRLYDKIAVVNQKVWSNVKSLNHA